MEIFYEIIGYLGTGLIILSMMMSSVKTLRLVNMTGAVFSSVYAILTAAYPVLVLNVTLIAVNAYKLFNEGRKKI